MATLVNGPPAVACVNGIHGMPARAATYLEFELAGTHTMTIEYLRHTPNPPPVPSPTRGGRAGRGESATLIA